MYCVHIYLGAKLKHVSGAVIPPPPPADWPVASTRDYPVAALHRSENLVQALVPHRHHRRTLARPSRSPPPPPIPLSHSVPNPRRLLSIHDRRPFIRSSTRSTRYQAAGFPPLSALSPSDSPSIHFFLPSNSAPRTTPLPAQVETRRHNLVSCYRSANQVLAAPRSLTISPHGKQQGSAVNHRATS